MIGDLVPRWPCDSFGQNWLCTWGVVALLKEYMYMIQESAVKNTVNEGYYVMILLYCQLKMEVSAKYTRHRQELS